MTQAASRPAPGVRRAGILVAFVLGACEFGQVVTLGHSEGAGGATGSGGSSGSGASTGLGGLGGAPPLLSVSTIRTVTELSNPEKDDNPTLTADELWLCFTSLRSGGTGDNDVWCAERASTTEPFGAPAPVDSANEDGFEASPALGLDGLELWFGSERDGFLGGSDIFVVTRASRADAWGPAVHVPELSSGQDDIPRPPAMNGTLMPLGSRRGDDEGYWTYFSTRGNTDAPFGPPELLDELADADVNVVDAFLTEDGLMILFTRDLRTDDELEGVYVAVRPNLESPFGEPTPVGGLDTEFHERDPWLSSDRRRLYFSSDRTGNFEIYVADVEPL